MTEDYCRLMHLHSLVIVFVTEVYFSNMIPVCLNDKKMTKVPRFCSCVENMECLSTIHFNGIFMPRWWQELVYQVS